MVLLTLQNISYRKVVKLIREYIELSTYLEQIRAYFASLGGKSFEQVY
jgi:hypothetical protein